MDKSREVARRMICSFHNRIFRCVAGSRSNWIASKRDKCAKNVKVQVWNIAERLSRMRRHLNFKAHICFRTFLHIQTWIRNLKVPIINHTGSLHDIYSIFIIKKCWWQFVLKYTPNIYFECVAVSVHELLQKLLTPTFNGNSENIAKVSKYSYDRPTLVQEVKLNKMNDNQHYSESSTTR